jgi:CheY-like chemotaxis protein
LSFEPAGFARARDALAEFQRMPQQFDLVIVDHLMPDITGIEFARAIRRLGSAVPVILCSGYSGPLLIQEALAAGVDRILTKPLDFESLARAIANARSSPQTH